VAGVLGAGFVAGCASPAPVPVEDLPVSQAVALDSALAAEVRFIAGGAGRTVLVKRSWPYLVEVAVDGAVHPVDMTRGGGPPWGGYVLGDSLWVFEQAAWTRWSLAGLAQEERGELPARTVAATHGCGDRLVAIFAGGQGPAAELVGEFGLRAFDSGSWWTLSDLAAGSEPAVYAAAGSSAATLLPTGEVVLFNGARGRLEVLPCGPLGGASLAIAPLARASLPVQPRGIAWADGVVVWFWRAGGRREERERTRVGWWEPGGRPQEARSLIGDVRLFGGGETLWLLDMMTAELAAIDASELLRALR
jgi:hypothetical protein